MDYFESLGKAIEQGWSSHDSPNQFAAIATQVITETSPPAIDTAFMARWMNDRAILPKQLNFGAKFGEPSIVVYTGEGFYIEVLFWFTSRTAIHGHGFAGAFRVLSGHSLQIEYSYQSEKSICEGLECGSLNLREVRLIGPGDVATIASGDRFIHCVAHLGQPSISLVARTKTAEGEIQKGYSRSGLAWRSYYQDKDFHKRMALVAAIRRQDDSVFETAVLDMVKTGDPLRCLRSLLKLESTGADEALLQKIAETGCPNSESRNYLLATMEERKRERMIWQAIQDFPVDQRLSIALGELFGSKAETERTIERFFPAQTVNETLAQWNEQVRL